MPEPLDFLLRRRSVAVNKLTEPGPDRAQLEKILAAAARVPDHGKLFPWHFIVFEGENRAKAGDLLARAWKEENPDAAPAKLELEAARFTKAPVVIAVVSRVREGKHPQWEQILSAGAACQNLCLAANAMGFGTNWVTGWYTYSPAFRREIGLDERGHFAGFIHIGTPTEKPEDRDRPELPEIVTWWEPGASLNKGDLYGHPGMGLPPARILHLKED